MHFSQIYRRVLITLTNKIALEYVWVAERVGTYNELSSCKEALWQRCNVQSKNHQNRLADDKASIIFIDSQPKIIARPSGAWLITPLALVQSELANFTGVLLSFSLSHTHNAFSGHAETLQPAHAQAVAFSGMDVQCVWGRERGSRGLTSATSIFLLGSACARHRTVSRQYVSSDDSFIVTGIRRGWSELSSHCLTLGYVYILIFSEINY